MTDSTEPKFDLRSLVRSVVDGSSLRGPREIAAKVAENVPRPKLREALEEALVAYVRIDLTNARRPTSSPPTPTAGKQNRNSGRSSKVAAIREAWRKTLAGQFHVGNSEWKVLADCSYENVMFLAAERHNAARRTLAVAEMFEALAEAMKKHDVSRAGDLPEAVLADILSREGDVE